MTVYIVQTPSGYVLGVFTTLARAESLRDVVGDDATISSHFVETE